MRISVLRTVNLAIILQQHERGQLGMAAAATLTGLHFLCCRNCSFKASEKTLQKAIFVGKCSKNIGKGSGLYFARSSNPQPEQDDNTETTNGFLSPEDVQYLWKLLAGSIGGAALIKYGSALFPEIAKPNLPVALLVIFLPVFVSVLLLIRQSSTRNQNKDAL